MSKEGAQHANLLHTAKRVCSECNGTTFQIESVTSNAGIKGTEGLWLLCQCGHCELIDFQTMGATANYV